MAVVGVPIPSELVVPYDGNVWRRPVTAEELRDGGCIVRFACGHAQRSNFPAESILQTPFIPCFRCSKVIWEAMALKKELDRMVGE